MKIGIIYKVTSPSKKVYIGQTIRTLSIRKHRHYKDANNKNCPLYNCKFYRAVRKYKNDLIWKVLYHDVFYINLDAIEIQTIELYDSYKKGYNSTVGGKGSVGFNHTSKTKKKMSERKFSEEHRQNLSKSRQGKKHTEETKKKISESKKMSKSMSGANNPRAKLTWNDVEEIRSKYVPYKYSTYRLAKEYNVRRKAIGNIINNKTWIK